MAEENVNKTGFAVTPLKDDLKGFGRTARLESFANYLSETYPDIRGLITVEKAGIVGDGKRSLLFQASNAESRVYMSHFIPSVIGINGVKKAIMEMHEELLDLQSAELTAEVEKVNVATRGPNLEADRGNDSPAVGL